MSLAAIMRQVVGTAFDVIDDIAPAGTITRNSTASYSVATGQDTPDGAPIGIDQIIPTRFRAKEIDGSVNIATDSKFIMQTSDLPFTPENGDMITFNGGEWNVVKVMGVPGESIWILHVRKH